MSSTANGLNLLRVEDATEGTAVMVESTTNLVGTTEHTAYVDDDGIVRQASNGAAFNADSYAVKESSLDG